MTDLSLIVAMDENQLIGCNNGLPWHLPADLAYFRRTTMGKPIVMGRKTFESIGKPLPGRRNIIVTRDENFGAAGCEVTHGIDETLQLCEGEAETMLIGGASLYEQALGLATRLYVTRIHHGFTGDTWFPRFDAVEWRLEDRQDFEADRNNRYSYSFIKFIREN